MADELLSVNVWLAGRSYRIRVARGEEETVRKAVKQADQKIMELRAHYAGRDDQDFIAMCLLMYATDSVSESSKNPAVLEQVQDMLRKIDKAFDD
jgi:cell division protein ZapA (FtsZ GTPase activity inhibitor)